MRFCYRFRNASILLALSRSLWLRTCNGFALPAPAWSPGALRLRHVDTPPRTIQPPTALVKLSCPCHRCGRRSPLLRSCGTIGTEDPEEDVALQSESEVVVSASTVAGPSLLLDADGARGAAANQPHAPRVEGFPGSEISVSPPDEIDEMSSSETSSNVPCYRSLIRFLSATSLIWLSEPLLSLVDTTFVGWSRPSTLPGRSTAPSTLLQLAAMGPATTYMDTLLYLTYFLAIATTNQVAEHLASRQYRELQLCTSRLLGVALLCGAFGTLLTWTAGPAILCHFSGASGLASPELLSLASSYARIRAAAAPLSVLGMVAQSFCLVTGRSSAVATSVGVASLTNLVGDALWTPRHGLCGAAAATAVASSAGAAVLVRQVLLQLREWRLRERENNPSGLVAPVVPFVSLPDRRSLRQLAALSLPLCFRMWALMGSYAALTWRAADLGTSALAAQNVLVRVFYLLCAVPDSIGQATQVFVPPTLYPQLDVHAQRNVVRRLRVLAALAGCSAAIVALALLSPWGAVRLLGYQPGLAAQLHAAAPYLALSLLLHPFVTVTEGLVLSKRDFANVLKTYSVSVALLGALLRWTIASLGGVWLSLVLWQVSRLWNYRLWRPSPPGPVVE